MTKDKFAPANIIRRPIARIRIFGISPLNRSISHKICSIFIGSFLGCQLTMILIRMATKCNFLDFLTVGGSYQESMRPILAMIQQQKIIELIEIVTEKYVTNKEELNEKQYNRIQKLYKYVYYFQKIYSDLGIIATLGYLGGALINGEFITNLWPTSFHQYLLHSRHFLLAWTIHSSVIGVSIHVLIQQDLIIFIFILTTLIEMTKLKYKFASIGVKEDQNNVAILRECIEKHTFLLSCLEIVENLFSPIILQILGTNCVLCGAALFGLLSPDVPKDIKIACTTGIILLTYQFFAYCAVGQLVEDQSLSVADAAYNSKWELVTDISIRKSLVLCIQRAQKPMNITIGGFARLSMLSFKSVAQAVFSFVTVILQARD